ncbi:hypothetical protein ACFQH6_19630 [Halobacteriaceae archaeon GCM10025711]
MATADEGTNLASTPRWALSLSGTFIVMAVVLGVFFFALSSPALLIVPMVFPEATPFLWLAVAGLVIGMAGMELNDEDSEILVSLVEQYQEMNRREKFLYTTAYLFILVGGISFEVAIIGIGGSILAQQTGLGLLSIVIALWYPAVDGWLGRNAGWNLASTGGLAALVIMEVLALLYQVPPTIPREAGATLRASLVAN